MGINISEMYWELPDVKNLHCKLKVVDCFPSWVVDICYWRSYIKNYMFIKEFINISAPYKNESNTGIQTLINMKRKEAILLALYSLAKSQR